MKRLTLSILMALAALSAAAQTEIKVQVPDVVAVDEQFNVTFVIEGEHSPSDFSWTPSSDFQLVWGPQKGSSSSISIVNGTTTKSSQTTFTYILLPKGTGKFTLPQATATVKKNTITSSAVTVSVVSNGAKPSGQGSSSSSSGSRPSSGAAASTGDIPSSDLFLRFSLSRGSLVVGEPVTATLKLYQRVNIAGFDDVKFPTFNGFWSQEVQAPTNIEFRRESIDDNIYNAAVLRSWVLIPQQAGQIVIDPAEMVCLVNVRNQSAARSIFDSFFEDDYKTIRKRVVSDRCTVKVSPLPAGAPASFGGGVGTYKLSARLTRDSLAAHDAASLMITLSGKGNVSLLEAPKVTFPSDFDVYDVKMTNNVDKSSGGTSGSRTFEYPFIPRSHGSFVIEPIQYSYYDVKEHKYVTLSTEPLTVNVSRGTGSDSVPASGTVVSGVSQKDVRDLGSDIRFIATRTHSFDRKGSFFCFSALFWVLTVLILLLAAAAYVLLKGLAKRRADVALSRNRGANKMARRKLSLAGDFLQKHLYTAFYEELHKALLGYVSDKLNIDMSDMSRDNIYSSLTAAGVNESLASEFTSLLEACEYARYSPDAGNDAMQAHYDNAVAVISSIDSSMKRHKSTGTATLATLLLLALTVPAHGAGSDPYVDSLWVAGTEAYTSGQWQDAVSSWQMIESAGLESVRLYCNLGDAFFKQGDYSHAILYYERALKLDPSDSDARFNLGYARQFIQDKIDKVPEFFIRTWLGKLGHTLSSDAWSVLFLLLFALACAMAVLFARGVSSAARKTGFFAGIVALCLSLGCLGFAASQRAAYRRADSAVVTRPVSPVKSAPGAESTKDLFVLHEGTKVLILDSVGDWLNIELPDGRQGWLSAGDVEII